MYVPVSVMRFTKCCNSFHLPAAANQATASSLNYRTCVFDVFSTRISAEENSILCRLWQLSWRDSRETLNEFQTVLSGNKWMDCVETAQTGILMHKVMFYGAELWVLEADVGFSIWISVTIRKLKIGATRCGWRDSSGGRCDISRNGRSASKRQS